MVKFLANENVPGEVVEAARHSGHDLAWISGLSPGIDDDAMRAASLAERRVPLTFDKHLGEMEFRQGKAANCGVILLRPRLREPDSVALFTVAE